jgi:hypothetical protein
VVKAAVAAGTTTDGTLAASPVGAVLQRLTEAFIPLVHNASAPFLTPVPTQTGAVSIGWIAEGVPKAISRLAFNDDARLSPLFFSVPSDGR